MLIDENARASRCSPLWYATNERIEGLVQHEVFSPTRLVCHFYDAYECNNCIRRSTAAGERWKMRRGERKKERGRGRGTTHGFVPKMGGERADASSFFAWFVHAQHRPRAPCLFAVPSPSLLPSCPLLPAYSILNDFSTWQAMIGLETLRISRKTACFSLMEWVARVRLKYRVILIWKFHMGGEGWQEDKKDSWTWIVTWTFVISNYSNRKWGIMVRLSVEHNRTVPRGK